VKLWEMTNIKQYFRRRGFMFVIPLFVILGLVGGSDQEKIISPDNEGCSSIGNPAYTYCTEIMGYDYRVLTEADGGQDGLCIMPDGLECPQWDFYAGTCGQEYSFCNQNDLQTEIKKDGKDPYSKEYTVCVDYHGKELGTFWSLSGFRMVTRAINNELFYEIEDTEVETVELPNNRVTPSSFDWRNYGGNNWMTSVKDQLSSCGSCWAFAAVGLSEAQHNIIPSNPDIDLDLSEQYLVSTCCADGDCGGGVEPYALEYIRDSGVPDEPCYPYIAQNSLCSARCSDYSSRLVYIPNAHWTHNFNPSPGYTEHDLKGIISSYGPVTIGIGIDGEDAGSYWDGDILRCTHDIPSDGSDYMDHAVLAVGYNDSGGYWIVKNSWGSTWNGDGYFKLGYNECNVAHSRISWVESDLPDMNQPPIANAGPDQEVEQNTLVTLNGSTSYDPDGDTPITYQWTQTSGTSVSLSSETISNPTFTSTATPEKLTFKLVVTDSQDLASTPDYVNIFNGDIPFEEIYLPLIIGGGSTSSGPIINGDFESGQDGSWTEYSTHGWDIIMHEGSSLVIAHSGSWLAWLGGDFDDTSYVSQSVTIPAGMPYLHYWYWIASEDACGFDTFSMNVDATSVHTEDLCEANNTMGWMEGVVNLSAYSGSTRLIKFEVLTDSSLNSNFYLDDISFSGSAATSPGVILPEGVNLEKVGNDRSLN